MQNITIIHAFMLGSYWILVPNNNIFSVPLKVFLIYLVCAYLIICLKMMNDITPSFSTFKKPNKVTVTS